MASSYTQLRAHRTMLRDRVRCDAYREAIARVVTPGTVVLDVGAGTGILSLFSAEAGARKVYAVERTRIAEFARTLVAQNDVSGRVEVIKSDLEDVQLPEPVDVLVSEWMGGYGIDENMLRPVLTARDRWLRPGGVMLPERVTAWLAPVWDSGLQSEISFFTDRPYGVDCDLIAHATAQERFQASHHIAAEDLLAEPQSMWTTDSYACSAEDARGPFCAALTFSASRAGQVNALAAWFSAELAQGIVLTNAPGSADTHWGRCVFPLRRAASVQLGDKISVSFRCEFEEAGWSENRWTVQVGNGDCEQHDSREAVW